MRIFLVVFRNLCIFSICLSLVNLPVSIYASDAQQSLSVNTQAIQKILSTPVEQTDLARIKFTIDKIIDPAIDIEASIQQIDGMVRTINKMAGISATSFQKMQAVRKFIYQAGDWNNHRPFHYDHTDPLGLKISNKLMTNFISHRAGNCITMPFLFILLADKMGLDVTASLAPLHVFAKFTDDATGTTFNVETTSGANPARDIWYRQNMPMTETALRNGVYMQPLTRKETIVVMATVLVEHYLDQKQYNKVIEMAELLLLHYPKYAYLYTKIGTAYHGMLNVNFYQKYPRLKDIPKQQRQVYQFWSEQNHMAFDKAEAMGWQPAK